MAPHDGVSCMVGPKFAAFNNEMWPSRDHFLECRKFFTHSWYQPKIYLPLMLCPDPSTRTHTHSRHRSTLWSINLSNSNIEWTMCPGNVKPLPPTTLSVLTFSHASLPLCPTYSPSPFKDSFSDNLILDNGSCIYLSFSLWFKPLFLAPCDPPTHSPFNPFTLFLYSFAIMASRWLIVKERGKKSLLNGSLWLIILPSLLSLFLSRSHKSLLRPPTLNPLPALRLLSCPCKSGFYSLSPTPLTLASLYICMCVP